MRTTRRQLIAGSFALLTLGGLAGCGATEPEPVLRESAGSAPSEPPMALTIGLTYIPNVQFSPFYVALGQGLFADRGLDVTLRHHGAQEDPFGAMFSGTEDVVFASGDEAVVASANGADLATFATSFQQFPGVLLASADSGITSLEDLRGRTIGLPGHYGSSYYTVLSALHKAGLDESDVDLQDIGFTQFTALVTGRVDAVVGYSNNETVQFEKAGFGVVELAVQDPAAPILVGPGMTTVPGELDDSILQALKDALLEAERRILENPDVAIEATATEVPTLSEPDLQETARAVLAATSRLWLRGDEPSLEVDTEAFTRMGEFLSEVGIIEAPPSQPTVVV
ncbi:MAG: ABC transporter substrate-binding protein [Arachnia sp.]